MSPRLSVYLARTRVPLIVLGCLLSLTEPWHGVGPLGAVGAVFLAAGFVPAFLPIGRVRSTAPIRVRPPVRGDWIAVNSPADKVPSHGMHFYGQTYAIDLVWAPAGGDAWRAVHRWPPARRPREFPAFGRPVFAPADGVVVRAHRRERDHWSRNSWFSLVYLLPEGMLRELTGPSRLLGNHVIIELDDGTYAVLAHLRRGSLRVRKGQCVRAGEQLAECGNSGNSSEPHLHFHLMDHRSTLFAAGLPFEFDRYKVAGAPVEGGVPGAQTTFTVPPAVPTESAETG